MNIISLLNYIICKLSTIKLLLNIWVNMAEIPMSRGLQFYSSLLIINILNLTS